MRYIEKYRELSHCQPKAATGNHEAEREVLGQALVRLALYRVVHPEAPISHARAFLFNIDPTVAPFCPSDVVGAEQLLGLRMKASSTTCERAYWAINFPQKTRILALQLSPRSGRRQYQGHDRHGPSWDENRGIKP